MKKLCIFVVSGVVLAFAILQNVLIYLYYENTFVRIEPLEENEVNNETIDESDLELFSKIQHPVLLWWSSFTNDRGTVRECGANKCFVTIRRKFKHHPMLKAYLFYGSNLKLEDLPLPKIHDWALFHEESPKNNLFLLTNDEVMSMINHTSTFKTESDMPLTTFHLDSLASITSTEFFKATSIKNKMLSEGKTSLVAYVHSDCGVPSERDALIAMVQKFIKVDCLGKCLHNKDLPENLSSPMQFKESDFYDILSNYKFIFAVENALCDDYTTEKFWRAIEIGVVPIVLGSNTIKNLLPHDRAAILIKDFKTVQDLVEHINYLNDNDEEYEKYLIHKTHSKITNDQLIENMNTRPWHSLKSGISNYSSEFECLVCNRIHEQINSNKKITYIANKSHYDCPRPTKFSNEPFGNLTMVKSDSDWAHEFDQSSKIAKAFRDLLSLNRTLSIYEILHKSHKYN